MNGAEFLARCLRAEGVEVAFGVPGEEAVSLLAAMERAGIRLVTAHSPAGAVWMAAAHGCANRRPGVVFSGGRAEAVKLAPALAACTADGYPVVAVAGGAATSVQQITGPGHLDLRESLRPFCKQTARLTWGPTIRSEVREAFRLAARECPGAVALVLPTDVAQAPVDAALQPVTRREPGEPEPLPTAVEAAAHRLDQAERPLVLAGHGLIRAGAHEELMALAERAGIPVIPTYMAKSVLHFGHPLLVGYGGPQSLPEVLDLVRRADVVLAAGYTPREWDPVEWNPLLRTTILHLGATPAPVSDHYGPTVEMVGNVRSGLARLTSLLEPRDRRQWAGPEGTASRVRLALQQRIDEARNKSQTPLHPGRVLQELRRVLGNQDLLTVDSGAHQVWAGRFFPTYRPGTYYTSGVMRAVGFALPAAVGLAETFARRERHRVAALMGDGGFLQQAAELRTAARLGLPLACVVLCDGRFARVEQRGLAEVGMAPGTYFGPLSPVDVARVAEAMGGRGLVAETAQELPHRLKSALEGPGPAVVAVAVTPAVHLQVAAPEAALGVGVGES